MNEREILEKIMESAQDLRVPETLKPEQIKKQLEGGTNQNQKRRRNRYRAAAAAACLCFCFGAAGLAYHQQSARQQISDTQTAGSHKPGNAASSITEDRNDYGNADGSEEHDSADHTTEDSDVTQETPVKKLGNMYAIAADYGEVYDVLKKTSYRHIKKENSAEASRDDIASADEALSGSYQAEAIKDVAENTKYQSDKDYSTTNLQVEGVDESDFVKTDGNFIYVVQDAQIQILDVRESIPAAAGTIRPKMDEDTDRICEMYVADRMLTLIVQAEKTELQATPSLHKKEDVKQAEDTDTQSEMSLSDEVQSVNTTAVTKVLTYDLTDPLKPALKNTTEQDGWYKTSRKIGNHLYLFTDQSLGSEIVDRIPRKEALNEDHITSWLPSVNGKAVSEDCIYLPKEGNNGLLMTSVDLADNSSILDQKLLINNYVNLYVTNHSVYLYDQVYVNNACRTRIARFSLDADGKIHARAAKTIKGTITDTFALHESSGYLRALTSLTDQNPSENRVYVLDENMEVTGKLTGLAKGEQIYAARFIGKTGYFVTYRNTDPLFTVDFSDPHNPKVIGELKVTGFSEYLHFWSDHKLLGIGMETNPQDGRIIGVKLSMFDISNPEKVKEEAKLVFHGITYCDGLYDYKSILADAKKNLIAFTAQADESYQHGYQTCYRVVSYDSDHKKFKIRAERTLAAGQSIYNSSRWRSVYVEDRLYLVSEKKTIVFDLSDECKEIGKLKYGWQGN